MCVGNGASGASAVSSIATAVGACSRMTARVREGLRDRVASCVSLTKCSGALARGAPTHCCSNVTTSSSLDSMSDTGGVGVRVWALGVFGRIAAGRITLGGGATTLITGGGSGGGVGGGVGDGGGVASGEDGGGVSSSTAFGTFTLVGLRGAAFATFLGFAFGGGDGEGVLTYFIGSGSAAFTS